MVAHSTSPFKFHFAEVSTRKINSRSSVCRTDLSFSHFLRKGTYIHEEAWLISAIETYTACLRDLGTYTACLRDLGTYTACLRDLGTYTACLRDLGTYTPCLRDLGTYTACLRDLGTYTACLRDLGTYTAPYRYIQHVHICFARNSLLSISVSATRSSIYQALAIFFNLHISDQKEYNL